MERVLGYGELYVWVLKLNKIMFGRSVMEKKCSPGKYKGVRCIQRKAVDPEKAEALGALEAVLWARERRLTNIHLEGDCLNVVRAIQGNSMVVNWTTNNIIADVVSLNIGHAVMLIEMQMI